ncbi:uncharacterized protein BJ171DRAFT_461707 [Polychytrium aggregatum]|uniref:uncharacterized protein n=1 Tax=Polychytrium aggregatum TaxID=110093 RepID=UPI0022FE8CD0|nr:uncharacterized protein BJ171DRAFT_461707 [Polychytrium aggregatum]KAI9202095.1 hypothetical protein BJ171DRAFT_461707 [Polychytrium aggregatum]
MDAAARQAVNLNVLRRHDPAISAIVDTSSHVVVYNFDSATETWKKVGIEGTMFLFRKESLNRYGIFVMNRLSTDNHNEELNSEMEIQVMGDYVIYRTLDDKVVGLWIYEASDRARIAKELEKWVVAARQMGAQCLQQSWIQFDVFSRHLAVFIICALAEDLLQSVDTDRVPSSVSATCMLARFRPDPPVSAHWFLKV